MKPWILLTLLAMLITPLRLAAFEHGRPDGRTVDAREAGNPAGDVISHEMRVRLGLPIRVPLRPEIREQIHRARHDRRHADRYPSYAPTIATTTVINEIRPVVVVSPPAETESPAPVKREWVPPLKETVTRPGYWDYAIKRTWMGDHWRYTQDLSKKTWVPATQVQVVTREGYWKIVE